MGPRPGILARAWRDLEPGDARDCACDAAEKAAWKMARTKLITAAGTAALLEYVTTGPITGLFELGETDRHGRRFRNVAASLAKITRRSQQAA